MFQADTPDYVDSIQAQLKGEYYRFWDFGHLLWRPLGWLVFRVLSPFLTGVVGSDQRIQITFALIVVSWLAGLMSAILLLALLRLYCVHKWVPPLIVTSFIFSAAELNLSRTGSSYVPGLFLLILGTFLVSRESSRPDNRLGMQAFAGLALAGSVLLWFPYVLAVPAAFLLPLATGTINKTKPREAIGTFLFFCLGIISAYVPVLIHLRLSSPGKIMAWMAASAHGIAISGISRAIFGWPRSFVDMGGTGMVIKRYMLHDSFNPVSSLDLLKLWPDLFKLCLFYATLFSITVSLWRSPQGRKALAIAAMSAAPVLGFAVYWSGGDLERYLPLYPVFFLVLGLSFADRKAVTWARATAGIFVVSLVLTNATTLRSAVVRKSHAQSEKRVDELVPRLKQGSAVVVSHYLDDLMTFNRNFPFNSINRNSNLEIYPLIAAGTSDVPRWRGLFAHRALSTWQEGGDVWISRRLLHRTPEADWNWIEGDNSRVSWMDLNSLFCRLQYGEVVSGDDGFVLLLPSSSNEYLLSSYVSK